MTTHVYTDGACSGSPGAGGWAWVTSCDRRGYGSDPRTTNQRMELLAALDAVQHLPGDLVIHSDSAYVVNCFLQGWWRKWRATNYKNGTVANLDLWKPLIDGVVNRDDGKVTFVKVQGHSGDRMNDLADKFAVAAKKGQLPTTRIRRIARAGAA